MVKDLRIAPKLDHFLFAIRKVCLLFYCLERSLNTLLNEVIVRDDKERNTANQARTKLTQCSTES